MAKNNTVVDDRECRWDSLRCPTAERLVPATKQYCGLFGWEAKYEAVGSRVGGDQICWLSQQRKITHVPMTCHDNYIHCARLKAKFRADGRQVNFLEDLDKRNESLVRSFGTLELKCREMSAPDPYSFRTSESFVKLPSWQAGSEGTLSKPE